jgi:hypothetical protein
MSRNASLELTRQRLDRCAQLQTRPGWHGAYHRGHRRCVRAVKFTEANLRNDRTRPERRRKARAA